MSTYYKNFGDKTLQVAINQSKAAGDVEVSISPVDAKGSKIVAPQEMGADLLAFWKQVVPAIKGFGNATLTNEASLTSMSYDTPTSFTLRGVSDLAALETGLASTLQLEKVDEKAKQMVNLKAKIGSTLMHSGLSFADQEGILKTLLADLGKKEAAALAA